MVRQQKHPVGPVQQSRVLYRDDHCAIGEYHWYSYRAGERRRSPTGPHHLIVIPWTAVRITQDGSEPVIADTSTTVFYNRHQPYEAEQLLEDRPERSIYIVPDEMALAECVHELDPKNAEDPAHLLRFTHGPCDARAFLTVRWLTSRLMNDIDRLDSLATQEMLLWIMEETVKTSYACRRENNRRAKLSERANRRHADAVIAARELLVSEFHEPLNLPDIASAAGSSPYHLCRIFRQSVGMSIHQYRNELRLRASMEFLCDSRGIGEHRATGRVQLAESFHLGVCEAI